MILDEDGHLTVYVYNRSQHHDYGVFVDQPADAFGPKAAIARGIDLSWSVEY